MFRDKLIFGFHISCLALLPWAPVLIGFSGCSRVPREDAGPAASKAETSAAGSKAASPEKKAPGHEPGAPDTGIQAQPPEKQPVKAETAPPPASRAPEVEDDSPRAPEEPERAAGMQIIISYDSVKQPLPGITRKKEEAQELVRKVLSEARAPGAKFEELARKYSDQPNVERTCIIGPYFKGVPLAGFYRPVMPLLFQMKDGEVSGILDTPLGYLIVQRIPVIDYGCAHIWIQYKGAQGASRDCTRTREEALKLAKKVCEAARSSESSWQVLVTQYSEDWDRMKKHGGFMGIFSRGGLERGSHWQLGKALFQLGLGEVSDPVESPYGYHVLKRVPLKEYRRGLSQILIKYKGAKWTRAGITRSREEARELAEKVLQELKQDASRFAELAKKYSEHDRSAPGGGNLGYVQRDSYAEPFDEAAFSLKPGEISGIVETMEGFHIIRRWK